MLQQIRFKAMGTTVEVSLFGEDTNLVQQVLNRAPLVFEQIEQELSRFRKDSGLSRLNAAAGLGPQRVSPILAEVCCFALEAAEETAGLFDPTVLKALERSGYNESFQAVAQRGEFSTNLGGTLARPRWRAIEVDGNTITLPADTTLDLGGIAKGWAVDFLAEQLRPYGPAMVNAGGDIRATGKMPDDFWGIALADPHYPDCDLLTVQLDDEAMTTSGVGGRRWVCNGQPMHHLIDPRTQLPSDSDAHTVSVLGPSAVECETASKVALLLGMHGGAAYLERMELEGILVAHDGRTISVGPRFEIVE